MKQHLKWFALFVGIVSTHITFGQNVVRYDLTITDTIVNFSGKEKRGIAVNGQIPMPTLTFTEGDTAEIVVHNKLKESTSLHWHGLFLPNKEDGVPYLTKLLRIVFQLYKVEHIGITAIVAYKNN